MTGISQASDHEMEEFAPNAEPSHVHIPRPSRQQATQVTPWLPIDDLSLEPCSWDPASEI